MHDAVDEALSAVRSLRKLLKRGHSAQVTAQDECAIAKATAMAWFENQRRQLGPLLGTLDLTDIDASFTALLESVARSTRRSTYDALLKSLGSLLVGLRSEVLALSTQLAQAGPSNVAPPNFTPLASDVKMQQILARRWREARACIDCGAPLAAIVMMGGLLEGLLVARVNLMPNKAPAFTAQNTPRDRQGKTLPEKEWTLHNYLEIAHELHWIGRPARDIGVVLREYRNYIHPAKELRDGIPLNDSDCAVLWSVFTTLAQELLTSAKHP